MKRGVMDLNKFCIKLKYYRDKGIQVSNFFGKLWFISRLVGIFLSVYFMFLHNQVLNIYGYFLIGFVGGSVCTDIRVFIKTKRCWPLQKEIIDWDKVEVLAENKSQN
jgi:hypothetical protein